MFSEGAVVTSTLSTEQLNQYHRDGIVFPVSVLSQEEVLLFRAALESLAGNCEETALKRFDNLHLFFPWAYRLVTHEHLLNAVAGILGDDILVDASLVFYKRPHDPSYVSWHQDSVYTTWHLTPSTSAWIALTASRPANGCMRVIPGSHKSGSLHHVNISDPNMLNRRGERIDMVLDESQAIDVLLRPGEMSLHQSTVVHGSNSNVSEEPRIGFIVRFVTSQTTNPGRPMLRVRGAADCSHLDMAQPPRETDPESALTAWRVFTSAKTRS